MEQITITVNRLSHSAANVRKTGANAHLDELKASILAHGLLQNLVVTPAEDGKYTVVAGGRRLSALKMLVAEGKLPASFGVPCRITDVSGGYERSLAENVVRVAMHPADEYEAYAGLVERGLMPAVVAERFGVSEKHVLQRLRLGRAAPELLSAYRAGELSLQSLLAFAITDDVETQMKIYRSLQDRQRNDPHAIRRAITGEAMEADDKLARFVGIDAYRAAGGVSRADLFSDAVYLENPELAHRLVGEKLESVARKLEDEGWGWVEAAPDRDYQLFHKCGSIRPRLVDVPQELIAERERLEMEYQELEMALEDTESDELIEEFEAVQARVDGIHERIAAFEQFDSEEMVFAGCLVSIDSDGSVRIEKGLVKPQDRKHIGRSQVVGETITGSDEPEHAAGSGLPRTLMADLAAYRQAAAQAEIARNPDIAFDLLTYVAACRMFGGNRLVSDGPEIQFVRNFSKLSRKGENIVNFDPSTLSLSLQWLEYPTEAERFSAFCELSDAEKRAILAVCVALTIRPKLATVSLRKATAFDIALARTGGDVAAYWRPTADNYFLRVAKFALLSIGSTLFGSRWADKRKNDKKGELATVLAHAVATADSGRFTPEQAAKLKRWLPEGMSFALPDPEPAEPAKIEAIAA
jgi:ParB family chromosome partitioning protein